jgi:FixJ family two-component response regulator
VNRDASIVFVVDDDPGVTNSIRLLLRSVGLESRTYTSAVEFLEDYDPETPGCLLLDVRMPGMSGLELQRHLVEMDAPLPIIFVTAHGDVPMAVDALKSGAMDFIQKPFRDQELLDKVHAALAESYQLREEWMERDGIQRRIETLSPREREVLARLVTGDSNREIAQSLGISPRTVEIHRGRVMRKMESATVSALVRMATRPGVRI